MSDCVEKVELGDLAGPCCLGRPVNRADLAAFGAALPCADSRALYAYWLDRWRDGRPPRRADILPEELGRLLPRIFLIGVEAGSGRLRYRLVGSALAAALGYDSTGRYLDEVSAGFPETVRARWNRRDRLTVDEGRPLFGGWTLEHIGRGWRSLASLRLPLVEDGRVTHLLGYGSVE